MALAEGMQTSSWRLDRSGVADELIWYSIDLPPFLMELRTRLLPIDDRIVELTQSALDRSWMDRIDSSDGVFITAEGLLMYLEPDDVLSLIRVWRLMDDLRWTASGFTADVAPALRCWSSGDAGLRVADS